MKFILIQQQQKKGCINSKKSGKGNKQPGGSGVAHDNNANKQFIRDAFEAHNKYRTSHNATKLKLNADLCKTAQLWAEHIASTNNFEHSNNTYMGQSLGLYLFVLKLKLK